MQQQYTVCRSCPGLVWKATWKLLKNGATSSFSRYKPHRIWWRALFSRKIIYLRIPGSCRRLSKDYSATFLQRFSDQLWNLWHVLCRISWVLHDTRHLYHNFWHASVCACTNMQNWLTKVNDFWSRSFSSYCLLGSFKKQRPLSGFIINTSVEHLGQACKTTWHCVSRDDAMRQWSAQVY